jgi:transcriptional regulator with XRE-family HTH domain
MVSAEGAGYPTGTGGFGLLLRRHRTAAGLTQVRLAERSGYYVNYLRKLERGERRPSEHVTTALAEALQLSAGDRALFERARHEIGGEPTLVGRERELAILNRHLDYGGSRWLMLSGEPGIGKSRLLSAARHLAGERGMLTLEAACRPENHTPFAPFREALERPVWEMRPEERIRSLSGCERLSHLIAESIGVTFQLRPVPEPEEERRLVFEAAARFVTRLAGGRDIVLLLDDTHLADDDTLDLLRRLLSLSELPLHIIGTRRDTVPDISGSLGEALTEMADTGMADRRELQSLTRAQANLLLDEMLGDAVGPEQRDRLIRRAGGNPGLLVSLAGGPLDGPIPEDIGQEILERVHSLPETAREALRIVAMAGGSASNDLLAEVSRQSDDALRDALHAACASRLLNEVDGAYECRCGVITEAVSASLPPAGRAALRGRISRARRNDGMCAGAATEKHDTEPVTITLVPAPEWCVGP